MRKIFIIIFYFFGIWFYGWKMCFIGLYVGIEIFIFVYDGILGIRIIFLF